MSATIDTARNNEARAVAAQALLRQNALEALPELLGFASDRSDEVSRECQYALIHLLPQITENNRDLMPFNSEELIGRILERPPHFTCAQVIFEYLEKFGQGRNYVAVVFYLNTLDFHAEMQGIEEVRVKGWRVYDILKKRRERNQESEVLLRHSSAPAAPSEELLRPAASVQTASAEHLLRAVNSQE